MPKKYVLKLTVLALGAAILIALASVGVSAQATPHSQFSTLYRFLGSPDGAKPQGGLIQTNDHTLYGTTVLGGSSDVGTIFKLQLSDSGLVKETVVDNFNNPPDGNLPSAAMTLAEGTMYGTTGAGGLDLGFGTIFELNKTGQHTVLVIMKPDETGGGPDHLVFGHDGYLYGAAEIGGSASWGNCPNYGCGAIFRMDLLGQETLLYSFAGETDGANPHNVKVDRAGNIYGTTSWAGSCASCGTVFKLDQAGRLSVLYSFTGGVDGEGPHGGVARDSAGNLYGVTFFGGLYGQGVIYKLDTTGHLTLLHTFTGADGANPYATLIWGPDGLYGTTVNGGAFGFGVVFKIAGTRFRVLHSFTGGTDGANPYAELLLGPHNEMYGVTYAAGNFGSACGTTGCGTVFRVIP